MILLDYVITREFGKIACFIDVNTLVFYKVLKDNIYEQINDSLYPYIENKYYKKEII